MPNRYKITPRNYQIHVKNNPFSFNLNHLGTADANYQR